MKPTPGTGSRNTRVNVVNIIFWMKRQVEQNAKRKSREEISAAPTDSKTR